MELCIRELGLNANVKFLGYRSDISNILVSSDIFITCSKHETFGMSLLEAGFYGLPAIATDIGGMKEIVGENCGFLIKEGDVKGFSNALLYLINNEKERKMMGLSLEIYVKNKFSHTAILNKLNSLYLKVIRNES